jgi:hypothetical protein
MIVPFPVVGIMSMAFSKKVQRVGDRVANTVVVRHVKPYSLNDTILRTTEKHYTPTYANVLRLSDKDFYTIKQVLDECRRTGNYSQVDVLAQKAREILEINDDTKPYPLLKTLLEDYNHIAKQKE